jgi:hypothetical protein
MAVEKRFINNLAGKSKKDTPDSDSEAVMVVVDVTELVLDFAEVFETTRLRVGVSETNMGKLVWLAATLAVRRMRLRSVRVTICGGWS